MANLIPTNVANEFRRRLTQSRGYEAKRAAARRWVYSILVGRYTSNWWVKYSTELLSEMKVIEREVLG
ncbi:MAG: hypothetical protein C0401_06510 [Anaerolinea sp.]|nr:hypothetical protein [Anaerolinea sp.]